MPLYLIPTPIGNLEDITLRALTALKAVDTILCEDTRQSAKLLAHFDIKKSLQAFHQHNEHHLTPKLIDRLAGGEDFGLITDTGTPGISDPGFLLVRACAQADIEVVSLPGATAFVPALVNSALPCERFCFEGFLPHKKGRQSRIKALSEEERSMIFYESPYRILKTLKQLGEVLGDDRQASISREISKLHEETVRGTLAELHTHFEQATIKGEFVLVVAGKSYQSKT